MTFTRMILLLYVWPFDSILLHALKCPNYGGEVSTMSQFVGVIEACYGLNGF
jgi:hypothetical protein